MNSSLNGKKKDAAQPNVIFILCDDLGYGDPGCYGGTSIPTPNIDRLAEQSMRFTQCYAGAPVCAPSRCVLMTGLHTGHCTVRDNFAWAEGLPPEGRVSLRHDDITVAEDLKRMGYTTGITGKWGIGEPGTEGIPNRKGFDEWFGYLNQRHAHSYFPTYLWKNQERIEFPPAGDEGRGPYSHDLIVNYALDYIRRSAGDKFFLYLPWCLPHEPYEIPAQYAYPGKDTWSAEEKAYASMVRRIDADLGRIMDLLDELHIADKTLLFFGSDHGAARRWEGVFDSCGPLRGQKADLYEGGIRTPMIVRWPGTVPAGTVCHTLWWYADFLPTIAEVTGNSMPTHCDGLSILPLLRGKTECPDSRYRERLFYWEGYTHGFEQAVRWKNWKALRKISPDGVETSFELYDLASDVAETTNLAAASPELAEELRHQMILSRRNTRFWPIKLD